MDEREDYDYKYFYKGYIIWIVQEDNKWNYRYERQGGEGRHGVGSGYNSASDAERAAEEAVLPRRSARENQLLAELGF